MKKWGRKHVGLSRGQENEGQFMLARIAFDPERLLIIKTGYSRKEV